MDPTSPKMTSVWCQNVIVRSRVFLGSECRAEATAENTPLLVRDLTGPAAGSGAVFGIGQPTRLVGHAVGAPDTE